MRSTDITPADWQHLHASNLARFREFFIDLLSLCWCYVDARDRLVIHCSEPWIVDVLMDRAESLRQMTRQILGASEIRICFAEIEVYSIVTV